MDKSPIREILETTEGKLAENALRESFRERYVLLDLERTLQKAKDDGIIVSPDTGGKTSDEIMRKNIAIRTILRERKAPQPP